MEDHLIESDPATEKASPNLMGPRGKLRISQETTVMEVIHGVIHGKTVELQRIPAIADGEAVEVVIRPLSKDSQTVELLRRSAGGWAEDADELDEFLAQTRQSRRQGRVDPAP